MRWEWRVVGGVVLKIVLMLQAVGLKGGREVEGEEEGTERNK
jgi:hypothetical protein